MTILCVVGSLHNTLGYGKAFSYVLHTHIFPFINQRTMNKLLHAALHRAGLLLAVGLLAATSTLAQQVPMQGSRLFRLAERKVSGATVQSLQLLTLARTQTLTLDLAAFRAAAAPQMRVADMPVAPGITVDLELYEQNNIAPGADRSYTDANGRRIPLPAPTVRTFRGKVANDPTSDVFLAIGDRTVLGHVNVDGKGYEITTDLGAAQQGNLLPVVTYPFADLPGNLMRCGVSDENLYRLDRASNYPLPKHSIGPRTQAVGGVINYSIKAGFDADYEYLQRLFSGDVGLAQDYMVSLAGKVSAIYERDLETQIVINYIHIWGSQSAQPYKESASMDQALYEGTGYWKDSSLPDRAFMSILSGKPWVNPIGIAWLDVLCIDRQSCNYSAMTYTNPSRDIEVLAHEIGHNFSMRHTHDCSWGGTHGGAIDRCAPAEGGSCFTGTEQQVGTIMSYCAQKDLRFDQIQIDWMLPKINANKFGPNGGGCFEFSRKLTVIPQRIIFPIVKVGNPIDTTLNAMFRNNSKDSVVVTQIDLTGDIGSFDFATPLATPFTLKPGESKSVEVTFNAKIDSKPQYLKMLISHTGLNFISQGPIVVSFEAFAENYRPVLGFQDAIGNKLDFGKRTVLVPVLDTLKYVNQGSVESAPLHVDRTEITGPDRFDFEIVDGSGPFDLPATNKRNGVIQFTPSSVGKKTAWLKVHSNSNNIPDAVDSVMLTGEGVLGSGKGVVDLRIRSGAINFGDVVLRKKGGKIGASADTSLANFYYNAGTIPLYISFYDEGKSEPNFEIPAPIVEIAPGQGDELSLDFYEGDTTDAGLGLHTAIMVVTTEDVTDPNVPVFVQRDTIPLIANVVREGTPSGVTGEQLSSQGINIVPNPVAAMMRLSVAPAQNELGLRYKIIITDAAGSEQHTATGVFDNNDSVITIPTSDWPVGTYYITVQTKHHRRVATVTVIR